MQLPPEDQPETVDIGPVTDIPVFYDDDPRLEEDKAKWSAATKTAQALHSPDELLSGLRNQDWRVRHQTVDRLIGRAKNDPRTLPALVRAANSDESWQVRDACVMRLKDFPASSVLAALRIAAVDPHPEVRWAAAYSLSQLGVSRDQDSCATGST
jgi:HEAT repeat protein